MVKHYETVSHGQSFVGTMSYMAPEVVDGGYDGFKVGVQWQARIQIPNQLYIINMLQWCAGRLMYGR